MVRSKLLCKEVLTVLSQGVGGGVVRGAAPLLANSYPTASPSGTRPLCGAALSARCKS